MPPFLSIQRHTNNATNIRKWLLWAKRGILGNGNAHLHSKTWKHDIPNLGHLIVGEDSSKCVFPLKISRSTVIQYSTNHHSTTNHLESSDQQIVSIIRMVRFLESGTVRYSIPGISKDVTIFTTVAVLSIT